MATRSTASRPEANLVSHLLTSRAHTDALFDIVRPDALYERTIPERHRIIFYLGHLEAFDWNLLGKGALGLEPFDAALDKLFAFGIDPVDGGLPRDVPEDWPELARVRGYCAEVRRRLDEALVDHAEHGGSPEHSALAGGSEHHAHAGSPEHAAHDAAGVDQQRMWVAIEHRLMHAETLAYILHHLPYGKKVPQQEPPVPAPHAGGPHAVEIPAGRATLGLPRQGGRFGWDNEFDGHQVDVPAFSIERCNVTHARYLEFMHDGGYERRKLWTDADWAWKERQGITHPFFWTLRDGQWWFRGMFREIPLRADWPVYVSHAEASAFARWARKKLPTEAQFHRAAYGSPEGPEREYPWGNAAPGPSHGNFDFHRWDPVPVDSFPAGDSAWGVADLLGNGWEWTSSVFGPFVGFEAFPFYKGYSADFFDGKHFVIKGGSPRTAACMLRRSFRNWFQPRYPYLYASFRCVES